MSFIMQLNSENTDQPIGSSPNGSKPPVVGSTVILGDCVQLMKGYADKYFDLAIVDPPYGIDADKKNNGKNSDRHEKTSLAKLNKYKTGWDSNIPDIDYYNELLRVSKHQIIWGANYFGLKGGYIVWDKKVTMPTYSDGELAYCSKINSVKIFEYQWHGMLQGDMKNKEQRIHPTQKPVKLYSWILSNFAKEGDRILDTHLGSGSSRIAADKAGFDFTGFENDIDHYNDQEKRFKQYKSQLRIEGW
jgi:site-specific DNA-methyltransferase (adenine-specific)